MPITDPQAAAARAHVPNPLRARHFPEVRIDDFSRRDSTIDFYLRVNALLGPQSVVLDLGAGRGEWFFDNSSATRLSLRDLRNRAGRVIGIDVDPVVTSNPAVHEAHVVAPDDPLPLPDESVDLVVCDWTFEHIAHPGHFAAEISRVLRPGGWACARTPNKWGYIGVGARVVPNVLHTRMLRRLQPHREGRDVFPVRYRLNTARDLADAFDDARWERLVYAVTTEPVYAGHSPALWRVLRAVQALEPRRVHPVLHVFVPEAGHVMRPVSRAVRDAAKSVAARWGYTIAVDDDYGSEAEAVMRAARPHTLTTRPRLYALWQAVRYVVNAEVPGGIVECGVWKGGSMYAAALTLHALGAHERELYLFDTFTGMTSPTDHDTNVHGEAAARLMAADSSEQGIHAVAGLDGVQALMRSSGYPVERTHFVPGDVLQTLPGGAPEQIALLRLDTDWYESTRHELETLYDRLVPGGVLILDDYGYWQGARRATDEFFATRPAVLLNRVDAGCRLVVKAGR